MLNPNPRLHDPDCWNGLFFFLSEVCHTFTVLLIFMYRTGSIKFYVAVVTITVLAKMASQATPRSPTKGANVDSKAKPK